MAPLARLVEVPDGADHRVLRRGHRSSAAAYALFPINARPAGRTGPSQSAEGGPWNLVTGCYPPATVWLGADGFGEVLQGATVERGSDDLSPQAG